MKILVLNGPNLNFLGRREPTIYGAQTLDDIIHTLQQQFAGKVEIVAMQSNHEGVLIDALQQAALEGEVAGVVLNAGAYTHTSVALRDAISSIRPTACGGSAFEQCARSRILSPHLAHQWSVCSVVAGFGARSYHLAVEALLQLFDQKA